MPPTDLALPPRKFELLGGAGELEWSACEGGLIRGPAGRGSWPTEWGLSAAVPMSHDSLGAGFEN